MDLESLLKTRGRDIADRTLANLRRAHLAHYEALGDRRMRLLVISLYETVARTIHSREAGPMLRHVEKIAEERFQGGFDLIEVQTLFNSLEESIWREVKESVPGDQLAEALGLVSAALGIGKDALARAYVSHATQAKAPSLDLRSLFSGT